MRFTGEAGGREVQGGGLHIPPGQWGKGLFWQRGPGAV